MVTKRIFSCLKVAVIPVPVICVAVVSYFSTACFYIDGNLSTTHTFTDPDVKDVSFGNSENQSYLFNMGIWELFVLSGDSIGDFRTQRIKSFWSQPMHGTAEISPDEQHILYTPPNPRGDWDGRDEFEVVVEFGGVTRQSIQKRKKITIDESFMNPEKTELGFSTGSANDDEYGKKLGTGDRNDWYRFNEDNWELFVLNNDSTGSFPERRIIEIPSSPIFGSVEISSNDEYLIYTPPSLSSGWEGTDQFEYKVEFYGIDNKSPFAKIATVTINENLMNPAKTDIGYIPAGVRDDAIPGNTIPSYRYNEGVWELFVLINDVSGSYSNERISILTPETMIGTLEISEDEKFIIYTPPSPSENWNGIVRFDYEVEFSGGAFSTPWIERGKVVANTFELDPEETEVPVQQIHGNWEPIADPLSSPPNVPRISSSISTFSPKSISPGEISEPIRFAISHSSSSIEANELIVLARSSDQSIIRDENIMIDTSDPNNCSVTVRHVGQSTGNARIRISAYDPSGLSSSVSFLVTVRDETTN